MIIKFFPQISKKDTAIAGGKGASLGEMTRAGISVPPGFVVLAQSFDSFIREVKIERKISAFLKAVKTKNVQSVNLASKKISALILKSKISKTVENQIFTGFKRLKAQYVAVRSSATAEDSLSASWAGELESYLNVTKKDLIKSVKKCWASLFTPRAIFYRFEKGLRKTQVSVAVVVQKMIQSEVSGIVFTVHPVTKDKSQMVIEAGYGLGEAIVGGKITPDTYVIDKKYLKVIDKNISTQNMMIINSSKGNVEKPVLKKISGQQKINDIGIIALAKLCLKIEKHYKKPQDIEWALEKGSFYILQARPITTL